MSIALVTGAHTTTGTTGTSTVTSSAIDTTGATLLILIACDFGAASSADTISDANANTWRHLTNYAGGSCNICIFYAYDKSGSALVVGSGHTFTAKGSAVRIFVMAFSGTLTGSDPYDTPNINGFGSSSAGSIQPGSVTPSTNGCLLICGMSDNTGGTLSIDSSFTITDTSRSSSAEDGGGAYFVQTTAAGINPTWSGGTSASNRSATLASFKPAVVASGHVFSATLLNGLGAGGPFFVNPLG